MDVGRFESSVARVEHALTSFDPARVSAEDAARVVGVVARLERMCAAARARAAQRVDDAMLHRKLGYTNSAEWLARQSGTTVGDAAALMQTALRVEDLPATRDAFVSGALSPAQASAVAQAARVDPAAEAGLLRTASSESLKVLRAESRHVQALARSDQHAHYLHQVARRSFHHWTDDDGMVCGKFMLPPDRGARVVSAIQRESDCRFRAAYKAGLREPHEAYAADALVAIVTGKAKPRAEVKVSVSLPALRRGRVVAGEVCRVDGFGDISVQRAQELLDDNPFVKGVVDDGVDIRYVNHFRRRLTAEQRTALEIQGVECDEPGCDRSFGLEIDHVDPVANGGPTHLDNVKYRCRLHHREKTERDHAKGLLRGPREAVDEPP
jgi:hypothetical protein